MQLSRERASHEHIDALRCAEEVAAKAAVNDGGDSDDNESGDLPEYTTPQARLNIRLHGLTAAENAIASGAMDKRRGAASELLITEFKIPIKRKDMRTLY